MNMLVIGNGFDLAHGLLTSYSDFLYCCNAFLQYRASENNCVLQNEEVEKQCTRKKAAKRLIGGDEMLAVKLLSRINMITAAEALRDIVVQKALRFHKLENKGNKRLEGLFAIDEISDSTKTPWERM